MDAERSPFDHIVARSGKMLEALGFAQKAVRTDLPVLLEGESGTGRSLVARAIQANGTRSEQPCVTVHGGEVLLESLLYGHVPGAFTGATSGSTGVFEGAHEGTLPLLDIDTLKPSFLKMLPRILREKALRRIGDSVLRPANVQLICTSQITLDDLSPELVAVARPGSAVASAAPVPTLKKCVEIAEFAAIRDALKATGDNQTRAAKILGISRVWLRKKMQHYGLLAES